MPGLICREYEGALMDLARRRPVDAATHAGLVAHVENCARCRHLLDSQVRLSAAAGVMADDASRWNAPFRVEQAVMAEARSVRAPRRRRFIFAMAGAALAASIVMVWTLNWSTPKPEIAKAVAAPVVAAVTPPVQEVAPPKQRVRMAVHRAVRSVVTEQPERPFIAIPYTMPLQPYEYADVVRMDVPVAALIAAGFPMEVSDPSARARTDVLVGQDGQARAVRLISISMVSYQGVSQQ